MRSLLVSLFILIVSSSCNQANDFLDDIHIIQPTDSLTDSIRTPEMHDSINDTKRKCKHDTIRIAHWNIGHFSLGKSSNTTITASQSEEKTKQYHQLLDTLNVDCFTICEYNPIFDISGSDTYQLLFHDFPNKTIGVKNAYNCNTIFSKWPIIVSYQHPYNSHVQYRYWNHAVIQQDDIIIHIIATHLDWNQGSNGATCRQMQMEELAETFKKEQHVILCADYNSNDKEEYRSFLNRGYTLAYDWISDESNKKITIDNIIVKGFEVVNSNKINDNNLSDHPLLKATLRIL